jgi:hypothetical protein
MDIPQVMVIVVMLLLLANGLATALAEIRRSRKRQPTKSKFANYRKAKS